MGPAWRGSAPPAHSHGAEEGTPRDPQAPRPGVPPAVSPAPEHHLLPPPAEPPSPLVRGALHSRAPVSILRPDPVPPSQPHAGITHSAHLQPEQASHEDHHPSILHFITWVRHVHPCRCLNPQDPHSPRWGYCRLPCQQLPWPKVSKKGVTMGCKQGASGCPWAALSQGAAGSC